MTNDKKFISIPKAAIIGLIIGFALPIIGIELALINLATDLKVLHCISSSFFGLIVLAAPTSCFNNYSDTVFYMFCGGQVLLGAISGILLAVISKKSRQLNTFWFGERVAIILIFIGMIIYWLWRLKVS